MEWFWSERWTSIPWVRWPLSLGIGALAMIGLRALWIRRSPMLPVALGAALIFGGLCLINPGYFFRWHRLPLHYTLLCVMLLGASQALRSPWSRSPRSRRPWGLKTWIGAASVLALVGLPFALRSYRNDLVTRDNYRSRVLAYDGVIDFIRAAELEHLTLLTAEPGYVAYHTGNPVIDAAGLVSRGVSFGKDNRECTTLPDLLRREPSLILARAPFLPRGYRVLLDLDYRCRLLMRTDLWAEPRERFAGNYAGPASEDTASKDTGSKDTGSSDTAR